MSVPSYLRDVYAKQITDICLDAAVALATNENQDSPIFEDLWYLRGIPKEDLHAWVKNVYDSHENNEVRWKRYKAQTLRYFKNEIVKDPAIYIDLFCKSIFMKNKLNSLKQRRGTI